MINTHLYYITPKQQIKTTNKKNKQTNRTMKKQKQKKNNENEKQQNIGRHQFPYTH